ncbi:hypothetical protein [Erwinia sp. ErVv1]|uniref:hypothetical protein n=1 Tax=Erwinia sp. ErVv1 TaxID=1603299 RepID=UPI000834ED04|nr:hypothetical protein [Erwinia sp. ErVv1]
MSEQQTFFGTLLNIFISPRTSIFPGLVLINEKSVIFSGLNNRKSFAIYCAKSWLQHGSRINAVDSVVTYQVCHIIIIGIRRPGISAPKKKYLVPTSYHAFYIKVLL